MNVDISKGFVDLTVDPKLNIVDRIKQLKLEKNAIILAHYYTTGDIQSIADFVGDSLALSQRAADTDADIILFAGVHFMAETAKILSPDKKVLIPDLNAGCSLAESCSASDFMEFKSKYPDHKVVSYVNTTAEIKAVTDITCTSSNAVAVVNSFPSHTKIIFAPDRNLGSYVKNITGREDMVLWDGACHIHEAFDRDTILNLKEQYPEAKIVAHPECRKEILDMADFVGSTSAILTFCGDDSSLEYIVITEQGILYEMNSKYPNKRFIAATPKDNQRVCDGCEYMKLTTMKKIYLTLKYELPEILMDETIRQKAEGSIRAMLAL